MGVVNWIWDCLCCRRKTPYNPDVPCGWIYALGVALMILFTILGATVWNGDIRRLTHGFDYKGDLCGVDSEVSNNKYLYWCAAEPFNTQVGDMYPNVICNDCRICLDHCPGGNGETLLCPMPNVNNFVMTGPNGTTSGGGIHLAERLDMVVVQKTAAQPSYPSEPWGGRYCLPKENENNIRHDIQDGPYGGAARFGAGLGSLENAWLVFLICGLVSLLIGLSFICCISAFAGIVLFGTMILSFVIVLVFAIFFLIALFDFQEDQSSWYQGANPLYDSVDFDSARGWSVVIGFILLLVTAFLACFTCRSVKRIDETMGMVAAATDAFHQNKCLFIIPCFSCVVFFVAIGLMVAGLLLVYSIGDIEPRVEINGKYVQGLESELHSPWYMYLFVALFAIMIWWTVEVIFACTQLMTSAVMWDFFLETDTKTEKGKAQTGMFNRNRTSMTRVSGVDRYQDARMASIGNVPGGQVMLAPVGQGMPGFRDQVPDGNFNVTYQAPDKEVKRTSMGRQGKAAFDSLWLFPSACWGALWVGLTRIPRWIGHFIGVEFVYEPSVRKKDNYSGANQSQTKDRMWSGCGRAFMWIENILGLYNGNSFTELLMFYGDPAGGKKDAGVRETTKKYGFLDASRSAMDDLNEAHGAVSFLKGALMLYEVMASFLAFWICLGIALLLISYVSWWNDEDSDWYVDNTALAVFAAGLIGGIVTFLVMTTLTQVSDAFLYIFNYYRMRGYNGASKYLKGTQLALVVGHEKDSMPGDILKDKKHRQRAANMLLHEEGEGNEALPLLSTAVATHA